MEENLVYLIERNDNDFYSIRFARRLVPLGEFLDSFKEISNPLSEKEKEVLKQGGFDPEPSKDFARWKGWIIYENLEFGNYVTIPPTAKVTITEMDPNDVPNYLETKIKKWEKGLKSLKKAQDYFNKL